jgi:hypothetical protein
MPCVFQAKSAISRILELAYPSRKAPTPTPTPTPSLASDGSSPLVLPGICVRRMRMMMMMMVVVMVVTTMMMTMMTKRV